MKFTKMQALGNDFVVTHANKSLSATQIQKLCNRNFGVGADGFITVSKISRAKIEMNYWNADGTRAEMCGNGLRCAIRYSFENAIMNSSKVEVKTDVGILKGLIVDDEDIDVQIAKLKQKGKTNIYGKTFLKVDAGNPHAVTFEEDINKIDIADLGPAIENHEHFPNRTNVEFVQVNDDGISLRVWERGVGETLACGTGMVAAGYCAYESSNLEFPIKVKVPGGQALVYLDDEGYMCIKGPATSVFTGEVRI